MLHQLHQDSQQEADLLLLGDRLGGLEPLSKTCLVWCLFALFVVALRRKRYNSDSHHSHHSHHIATNAGPRLGNFKSDGRRQEIAREQTESFLVENPNDQRFLMQDVELYASVF